MSDQASVPEHRNTRPFLSLGVVIYFGILVVLTFVALMPGAITIGTLLFISPGLILIASGTVLVYSTALLPAYFINRHLGERLLAGAVAVFGMAAAALLPHYIGGYVLGHLAASYTSDRPTSFQPRSFELPYQDGNSHWTTWRGQALTRPPPPCADLCQQLLFKGNVDQVFVFGDSSEDSVTHGTLVFTGGKAYLIPEGSKRTFRPIDLSSDKSVQEIPVERAQNPIQKWRRFRLQRQETCPATLSIVRYAQEGRCLIEDVVDSADADVVVSISEAPTKRRDPRNDTDPCQSLSYLGIQNGPTTVTVAERRNGEMIPVERKTTLVAQYPTIPFYFGVRPMGGSDIPESCLGVATDPFPRSYADPFEMIGRRYGLPIDRPPESPRSR